MRSLLFWFFTYPRRWSQASPENRTFFTRGATAPSGQGPPQCRGFTITLKHTALGRTPPDVWSARRRELYLKTHNIYKRQTSMSPVGLELSIPASERLQSHALDLATTGIGAKQSHWPFGAGIIFFILAHPVYKMWIIQEPNTSELWNKLHFEEEKRRVYTMFKIFGTYICWINI